METVRRRLPSLANASSVTFPGAPWCSGAAAASLLRAQPMAKAARASVEPERKPRRDSAGGAERKRAIVVMRESTWGAKEGCEPQRQAFPNETLGMAQRFTRRSTAGSALRF